MKCNQKIKYISIVTFSTILDIILHGITSDNVINSKGANWSVFVKFMGFPLAITLYLFLAFSGIAYIFYIYEDKIPGIKSAKGIRFGIAIGLLWLWGMIEGVSLIGTTLGHV